MTATFGQSCSDIEKLEITDRNVCIEAKEWIDVKEFIDQTPLPIPGYRSGCSYWLRPKPGIPEAVIWNPVERGTPHEDMKAICLNSGKYYLVYHFLSQSQ